MTGKRWFLPENPDLLGMLRAQAAITVEGWMPSSTGREATARRSTRCAIASTRRTRPSGSCGASSGSPTRRRSTPRTCSRSRRELDEVLNAAKDLVGEMEVMSMAPDDAIRSMVGFLASATHHLADAFTLLGGDGDATGCADAAIKDTRRVEHVYRRAMSALLVVPDLREVIGRRESYRRISRIGGLILTVAERIWYAVVKES